MASAQAGFSVDGVPVVRLESAHLRVEVAPAVGGRVISLVDRATGHEFLWRNPGLTLEARGAGSEYDPNFYGGIDELLPNDVPEVINGVDCPDHGELWTAPLDARLEGPRLSLTGVLPRFGLSYERGLTLRDDAPVIECAYRLTNRAEAPRQFLWKLHAALAIAPGDRVECPPCRGQVVDPAWSRFKTTEPFVWPRVEGRAADIVPEPEGTMDFFYLFELEAGWMGWRRPASGLSFTYEFDRKIFPYAWLFASYGGFNGHYTVVLEPCTARPIRVNDAARRNQCSRLEPGATLATTVTIRAGRGVGLAPSGGRS